MDNHRPPAAVAAAASGGGGGSVPDPSPAASVREDTAPPAPLLGSRRARSSDDADPPEIRRARHARPTLAFAPLRHPAPPAPQPRQHVPPRRRPRLALPRRASTTPRLAAGGDSSSSDGSICAANDDSTHDEVPPPDLPGARADGDFSPSGQAFPAALDGPTPNVAPPPAPVDPHPARPLLFPASTEPGLPARTLTERPTHLHADGAAPDLPPPRPGLLVVSNAQFLQLGSLLRIGFSGALGLIPAGARAAFFGVTAHTVDPPDAAHHFPREASWRKPAPDIIAAARAASSAGIASIRTGFRAAFPTDTASDLPPDLGALLNILADPAHTALLTAYNDPAPCLAQPVSRPGMDDILELARWLIQCLEEDPATLPRRVRERQATRERAAMRLSALGPTPPTCPAGDFAQGALIQLASYFHGHTFALADRPPPPPPSSEELRALAHTCALNTVEDCLRWIWTATDLERAYPYLPLPRPRPTAQPDLSPWAARLATANLTVAQPARQASFSAELAAPPPVASTRPPPAAPPAS